MNSVVFAFKAHPVMEHNSRQYGALNRSLLSDKVGI